MTNRDDDSVFLWSAFPTRTSLVHACSGCVPYGIDTSLEGAGERGGKADQVNFFNLIDANIRIHAVRARAHVPNFGLQQLWVVDGLAGCTCCVDTGNAWPTPAWRNRGLANVVRAGFEVVVQPKPPTAWLTLQGVGERP